MLILLAAYQKMFSKKKSLSDMKYDVKTSEMTFLLIMSRKCISKWFKKYTYIYWAKVITQLCLILIISLFLEHVSNQIFISNESILPHNGFNNLFPTVQETNHFTEVGWLKKMKCMEMYRYPTCDMHFVQRKRCVEYWNFFRNSLHL